MTGGKNYHAKGDANLPLPFVTVRKANDTYMPNAFVSLPKKAELCTFKRVYTD